ncbi:MAG: hypothetical protein KC615_18070, partial [Anaerolineae bacterium]|nr:hypothetical protein [Anaerolineae bacterium]
MSATPPVPATPATTTITSTVPVRPKRRSRLKKALIFVGVLVGLGFLLFNVQTISEAGCAPSQMQSATETSGAFLIQDQAAIPYSGRMRLLEDGQGVIEIVADAYGIPLAEDDIASHYAKASVRLVQGNTVDFVVTVPADGEYTLAFDMVALAESTAPEGQLHIDGEYPISDLQRFIFPVYYRNSSTIFPTDRYGNDALISQVREMLWSTAPVRDVNFSEPYPLRLTLTEGEHQFSLRVTKGALYLG